MKRNYLIIGASKGIGHQLYKSLSTKDRVFSISRSEIPQASDHFRCDILNESLPEIDAQLDALVYCPGSINLKPFNLMTENDFIADFEINVLGVIRVIKQYIKNLQQSKNASVVLFSTVAVSKGMPYHASIASAKAAVEGLTRSLAAEYAPQIRFNAIAPSLTDTELAVRLLRTEKQREASAERHPMKRIGTATDIASAVEFLVSEKSSWITGQVVHVDGGLSTLSI